MAEVLEIEPYPLAHLVQGLGCTAEAVDLRQPRDAGANLVANHVATDELAIQLVVGHGVRARTDQAHPALQDIDQLRQLIQRGPADEPAHARDAGIAAYDQRQGGNRWMRAPAMKTGM